MGAKCAGRTGRALVAGRCSNRRLPSALLALALIGPGTARAQEEEAGGTLEGTILLADEMTPVAEAAVWVVGLDLYAESDSTGSFRIESVQAGEHHLMVHYRTLISELSDAVAVEISDGETTRVELLLNMNVVPVPELIVQIEAIDRRGKMAGFDRRRATAFGRFISREEIERAAPHRLSQLFYSVPGVRVVGGSLGGNETALYSLRGSGSCAMMYYLDGVRQPPAAGFTIDLLPPGDIEGIEIYSGPSRVPAIFAYRGGQCGVVAIWTRDPSRR